MAGISSMTVPNTLDWDAPEFDEEPSTISISSANGADHGDTLAQNTSISSSNAVLFPAAASSPMTDKAGVAGGSGTLMLCSSLGILPGTAAAPLPAPARPASDASGLTLAAAMPSVPAQEKASAGNIQPFASAQRIIADGAHSGKQPGSGVPLGIFGAVQQSGAAALPTQQGQPSPIVPHLPTQNAQPPGTAFGQQGPEQVHHCQHFLCTESYHCCGTAVSKKSKLAVKILDAQWLGLRRWEDLLQGRLKHSLEKWFAQNASAADKPLLPRTLIQGDFNVEKSADVWNIKYDKHKPSLLNNAAYGCKL